MNIAIPELEAQVTDYLIKSGFNQRDAHTLMKLVVEQEMIGNQFSAIGELPGKHARIVDNASGNVAEVAVSKPSAMLIKGNGQPAPIITADYLDNAIVKAKEQGVYALGIYDSTYNDFFDVFCRRAAAQDCVVIIAENGGPQGVVPFGGRTDITGTNPLAYGIPTHGDPIIFDAATAMHAYGLIRQAKERGARLPENAYVDKDGNPTTDPEVAHAVLPFGGFKGYAINLLIDVLSGGLVRGKGGLDQPLDSQRYIGTFIILIDPACFGELNVFKDSTTKLVNDILAVPALDPEQPVRVPGLRGAARKKKFEDEGMIQIADEEWTKFESALQKA